jgi:hypothetical protein|tara:strand:+ start:435 stop:743 length:309 start_codon:yes stop_codon:yes gene_type:complete
MSRHFRYQETEDNRNYKLEARELVKGLRGNQLYEMYEIVIKQLQRSNSPTKDTELKAVQSTIEDERGIDTFRLGRIKTGYKSSMAENANPRDGFTKPAKKKA